MQEITARPDLILKCFMIHFLVLCRITLIYNCFYSAWDYKFESNETCFIIIESVYVFCVLWSKSKQPP